MWNAKRVLIMLVGMVLFLGGYSVYSLFLGGIDGLPPLPPELLPSGEPRPIFGTHLDEKDKKIEQAFGPGCQELDHPIKIYMRDRRLALAAGECSPEKSDGRLKLSPFAAAMFLQPKHPGELPEIITLQCEVAFVTLDRPVQNHFELQDRKLVAIELIGGQKSILLTHNRGTGKKSDDLELTIFNKSVFYEEAKHLVWSEGFVKLLDMSAEPAPTTVSAQGLELHLNKELTLNRSQEPKTKAAAPAVNGPAPSSLELLVLRSNVDMNIWVDGNESFLGGAESPKPKTTQKLASKNDSGVGGMTIANKADTAKKPNERSLIIVKTNGPFHYNPNAEIATFDSPPNVNVPVAPEQVLVSRKHRVGKQEKYDQLLCDHLKLRFRKKDDKSAAAPLVKDADRKDGNGSGQSGGSKQIEEAIATARNGRDVVLTMDTENLEAYGNELTYRSAVKDAPAQTLLKGQPLHAVRDGHKIECAELLLVAAGKDGKSQQAFAKGPGKIDLFKRESLERPYPHHVTWRNTLAVTKVLENARSFDLLKVDGEAHFVDDEQDQYLAGERIDVWLEQIRSELPDAKVKASGARQKIHRVEAYSKVHARSPEFVISMADQLAIKFKYEVARGAVLPAPNELPPGPTNPNLSPSEKKTAPAVNPAGAMSPRSPVDLVAIPFPHYAATQQAFYQPAGEDAPLPIPAPKKAPLQSPIVDPPFRSTAPPTGQVIGQTGTGANPAKGLAPVPTAGKDQANGGGRVAAAKDAKKPRKPIVLKGQKIDIDITVLGAKNTLRELNAIGGVTVHQDPEKKGEKGVDIFGDILNLQRFPEGDLLTVLDQKHGRAKLLLQELTLVGPKVIVDQRTNRCDVDGAGAMELPVDKTPQGEKLAKAARMQIHWNQRMTFDGTFADFFGGVQAYQDEAYLKCETMQARLDRPVVFKEGQKANNAKIDKILCDRSVYVLERKIDPQTKRFESASSISGTILTADGQNGPVNVSGPGEFRHLSVGGSGRTLVGGPAPKKAAPPKQDAAGQLQLTIVTFDGRMFSRTRGDERITEFRDGVEVLHGPGRILQGKLDKTALPPDGFYLKAEILEAMSKKSKGKTHQMMVANRNVFFQADDFSGTSDQVKFDEANDQIIFTANPGNQVRLYQEIPNQPDRRNLRGTRIVYDRRTRDFIIDGVSSTVK